ncbi:MAG: NAD(P)-dependent oxidoreductase [Verrucomicrobia bacterium]|jgi:3-hydroxyisobutyrate dehydrogenase|nr:NAD(P)-dependent oxidoreductase [Verrucomicrobiota bacterium]MDB4746086.1 NAD(P)-dependent oxidoreductase [Verrucomicrobiota bacterium]
MSEKAVIGFVGIGVMGRSMAGHLLTAGYPVHVFNRTKEKAQPLLDKGAVWQASAGDVAAAVDVVITIVGFPQDVKAVYLGDGGIIERAKSGATIIDMTTSSPDLAVRIYESAKAKGIAAIDAPVSGGDIGAKEARLSIMVGGDSDAFEKVKPIFEVMGKNIVLQGGAGAGQHTKMSNQVAIASSMMAICEAMAYAKKAGLDPETVLKSIGSGAAGSWSLTNLAPRILKGDYAPGFFVKHFLKDMKIAIESAENMQLELPGLALAKQLYDRLAASGGENDGTQALFKLYEEQL